jgi:hypothetical protein
MIAPRPNTRYPGRRHHTISRRELNLFKSLRRHFPANAFCRQALLRHNAGGRSAAARETHDQLFQPGLRRARRELRPDRSLASGGRRNGFDGTGHSAFSFGGGLRTNMEHLLELVKQLFCCVACELLRAGTCSFFAFITRVAGGV